ncbi:MAG: hypothetical protein QM682_12050 [Paracoccus sp. (in: a-proteobacteria)]|uniref:hypothetical protein n=1 Tax=Paracoccus sp. TaxID=267 RepID=UPI0039E369ED
MHEVSARIHRKGRHPGGNGLSALRAGHHRYRFASQAECTFRASAPNGIRFWTRAGSSCLDLPVEGAGQVRIGAADPHRDPVIAMGVVENLGRKAAGQAAWDTSPIRGLSQSQVWMGPRPAMERRSSKIFGGNDFATDQDLKAGNGSHRPIPP